MTIAESRANHIYRGERVTPVEEIPLEFQQKVVLSDGDVQIINARLCYNCEISTDGKRRFVECGSVASDAEKQGFFPK